MCVPAKPAGCGPLKLISRTPSISLPGIDTLGAAQTFTGPSVKRVSTFNPCAKSSALSAITTVGSVARGLVSIAVTKMDAAIESARGTFENGRVLNATHCPEFTKLSIATLRSRVSSVSAAKTGKVSVLSPSISITKD